MQILENVSLKLYSTMRLGGIARFVTEVKSRADLDEVLVWADNHKLPIRMIGSGSNIIWRDEGFDGLLVINKIMGFKKIAEDHLSETYRIGAGENWDKIVEKTVELGLSGIECLSLIPGTAGATPVQNVGAYGQDISQTMVSLEAYDQTKKTFVTIRASDCAFSYRTSRFKTEDSGRFLILSVDLKLNKRAPDSVSKSVEAYLEERNISSRDIKTIRQAVIAIRKSKLPDPMQVANNGSFFANPIITNRELKRLRRKHPDIPAWEIDKDHQKLAAAWLIEKVGFKGKTDPSTGMSIWKNHALVFVNEHARATQDLLDFKQKIVSAVEEKFGVMLEQEPELLP